MTDLRAVVFDYYGTLSRARTADESTAARTELAGLLGVDPVALDAEMTATVDQRFRGAGGDLAGSLAWIAQRLGVEVPPAALDRAAARRLELERDFGRPRPDADQVLRALRERGLRVGVVSDCSAELPRYFPTLEIAALVDAAVFSFVTGHRKPEPENYLACCAALGVEPGDCPYVGDGGSNELAGAQSLGMRAVHLAVPEELGGLVYGKHESWDGETIPSLREVLALV
ncbi:MAG TPA: HAD family hydrolase [Jatrophihabitans sp.]|nr:HAD family hydrolase [Jatrophihabitans sp.]